MGQSSPKQEMPYYPPRSTILPNFISLRQPTPEISVTKNCGQTNKEMNKYASCPDWRNPHMPIAVTASGGKFVTRASQLPGQFVAPG